MARTSDAKRRASGHVVAKKANVEAERRKTYGAPTAPAASFPTTPSKHQVNLGSAAAQAYFFGDTPHSTTKPKTPYSMTKKQKTPAKKSPHLPGLDETADLADVSMLSAETSSSEESDLLNKSVLSDTTELTASNFVLQASSRQRLLDISRGGGEPENVAPRRNEEQDHNDETKLSEKPAATGGRETQQVSTDVNEGTAAINTTTTPSKPSPSLRSRLPYSLSNFQELTSSLRKAKQQSVQELTSEPLSQESDVRSNKEGDQPEAVLRFAGQKSTTGGVSFLLPPRSPARSKDATIEIETDKPLGDLLSNLRDPAQGTSSQGESTVNDFVSPSSTIGTGSANCQTPTGSSKPIVRQSTPYPKKDGAWLDTYSNESNVTPSSTKADDESQFRLTTGSRKKLTPTKLSQSPRRVVNPESADSPARNTRSSATKNASGNTRASGTSESVDSPARNTRSSASRMTNGNDSRFETSVRRKMDVSNPNKESLGESAGDKRNRDEMGEGEAGIASLSIRNAGRMSEITLSPSLSKVKRRRSSVTFPPPTDDDDESVHSTSTASTADLNMLLGSLDSEKETVAGLPSGMRNMQRSPATAEISVPRSILSTSSKRKVPGSHQSRRSVVFGSPEAAEYRIGSPSVSLTPMPRGTAKAMFSMPAPGSQSSSSSSSYSSHGQGKETSKQDNPVEMETDAGSLQPNLVAPDNGKAKDAKIASAATKSTSVDGIDMNDQSPSSSSSSPPLGQPEEDETVELESNIEGLFASAFGSPHNGSMLQSSETKVTNEMETSPAESVDMADAQSIASIASSRDERNDDGSSLEASSQKLNFEGKLSESPDDSEKKDATLDAAVGDVQSQATTAFNDEEENTIELEADLTALLSAGGPAAVTREAPIPVTLTKKFSKMDSNLVPPTNRLSFGDALVQGNDFSKTDDSRDSFTERSLTKKLEANMEMLLQASSGGGNTPSASRRRSNHRFSLTPRSRLSLTRDGSVVSSVHSCLETQTEESHKCAETFGLDDSAANENDEQEVMLGLENEELMELADLPETPSALDIADTLVDVNTNSENFKNPLIAEAVSGFFFAVCGEVEMKAESSSNGNSCFSALVEQSPDQLLQLQKALHSNDAFKASRGKAELKRLAQAARAFVEFEWKSWEVQVVDSLAKALDGIVGDFEESDERLMSSVTLADDALEAVSLMEGIAVQKARRRSMSRRKASAQALEVEIYELEQQIGRERAALEALQATQREQESGKSAILGNLALLEQFKPSRAQAETLQHRFSSLHGMHSWSPLVVDESNIVVGFVGASPKTCIKLRFAFAKCGTVSCHADVDPTFFKQRRGKKLRLTPLITEFVAANIEALVESVCNTKLKHGGDIPRFLHQVEMLHGRLEMTASEMFGLQKRYGTLLEPDPTGRKSDYLLSVDFASLSDSTTTLRATFELNTAYPFAPLNISLDDREGKVDVDMLRRQLVKNAKPGFWYMSRTCDTISAFLR